MIEQLRELGAKLRSLFTVGEFQKRYKDGDKKDQIQVKTHNNRVVEKKEAFPYGFYAKAKGGKTLVFCQGGNPDGFEIFPVQPGDDITLPELEEGDAALYTAEGGCVILREAGDVEITNTDGDLWIVCKKGGEVEIKGKIKVTGGSFACGGSVSPTGQGALCAMPYCAYTGAPQAGAKSEGT
jgi:phage gp45-like